MHALERRRLAARAPEAHGAHGEGGERDGDDDGGGDDDAEEVVSSGPALSESRVRGAGGIRRQTPRVVGSAATAAMGRWRRRSDDRGGEYGVAADGERCVSHERGDEALGCRLVAHP